MAEKIKMEFSIAISDRDIDDIMDTALCGIAYWCGEAIPDGACLGEYASGQISRGGQLKLCGAEGGECFYLTKEKFISGLKKYLENPTAGDFLEFANHGLRIDAGYVDTDIADAIIQCALFDGIVYGQGGEPIQRAGLTGIAGNCGNEWEAGSLVAKLKSCAIMKGRKEQ